MSTLNAESANTTTTPSTAPPRRRFSILKKVLLGFAGLVVVFFVLVVMQPDECRVSRSATMPAPAAVVFDQVNDFHNWEAWSPWAKLDPQAKNEFDGPSAGKGARFRWSGNDEVGEGKMTITESRPNELIRIDLQFTRPFESSCVTEFTFKPQGDETVVTWTMQGKANFMAKVIHLFVNMDKMVGGDFEKGLKSMEEAAVAKAKE